MIIELPTDSCNTGIGKSVGKPRQEGFPSKDYPDGFGRRGIPYIFAYRFPQLPDPNLIEPVGWVGRQIQRVHFVRGSVKPECANCHFGVEVDDAMKPVEKIDIRPFGAVLQTTDVVGSARRVTDRSPLDRR